MNAAMGNISPFYTQGMPTTNGNTKNFTGGPWTFTETARTSGASQTFTITPGNSTGQTASTEIIGFDWDTFTRTWATGAITTQREFLINAPTYAFAGASTVTNAATLAITAAPIAGTNATITNSYALWVQAGKSLFGGAVTINDAGGGTETPLTITTSDATNGKLELANGTGTSSTFNPTIRGTSENTGAGLAIIGLSPAGNDTGSSSMIFLRAAIGTTTVLATRPALHFQIGSTLAWAIGPKGKFDLTPLAASSGAASSFKLTPATDTAQTASTEIPSFNIATHTRQWSTGGITTQREYLFAAPTYAFVGASTITDAATLAITAAPIAGTNATITRKYALWIEAGDVRIQAGNILLGTAVAGSSAANGVLALGNGATAPTTSVDLAQLYSVDVAGAGTASLGIFTEQAVVTEAVASDRTLLVKINGTNYKILLAA